MRNLKQRCAEFLDQYDARPPGANSTEMLEAFVHAQVAREMARGKMGDANALVLFLSSRTDVEELKGILLAANPNLRAQTPP